MLERKLRRGARDRASESRQIGRFLEEAQITGQLDHPGIVPVHELGLNDAGQLYFTMRLVRGRDLRAILELVQDEREGWTVARALGVIQRVCEAMAYAHSKRVIHRDIKPSNIMVGRFGEVYVMDWGLAKVMGRTDMHDLRPAVDDADGVGYVHTDRQDHNEQHPDSPLQTMDGTVVGTPSYMSPEQALGQDDLIGPHSDIYSVGALLYQLLSGQMPYLDPGERASPYTLLNAVREGPPRPIHQINHRVPPELVAICEKAMARDIADRYPSMKDMADELRAFIEGRVVRTYETGALAEARKWVVRNKGSAAILAVAFMALAVLIVNLYQKNESLRQSNIDKTRSEQAAELARAEAEESNLELQAANEEARREADRADAAAREARYRGYVTSIAAAAGGLRFYELREATASLRETPAYLRGWEWEHLLLKADPSLATLVGHAAPVTAIAFGPKGTLLASASTDGKVSVWNTASRERLHVLDHGGDSITSVTFSPENGRTLACGGLDGTVTLWDAVNGDPLGELWQEQAGGASRDAITALVFNPIGTRLFAGTMGRKVCAWNMDNKEFRVFPVTHGQAIQSLAVSPDGNWLASGSEDRTAVIWDANTGQQLQLLFEQQGEPSSVRDVAFYPEEGSPYVATASADGLGRLYDTRDRTMIALYEGHQGPVNSVSFSPDGSQVLTSSDDGTIRRWNTFLGEQTSVLNGHEDAVNSAQFSPDGVLMASGSADTTVKLWDRAYEGGSTRMSDHSDQVHSLTVSPDGLRLVSSAWNARIHLWETDTLLSLSARDLDLEGAAVVAFSPNGKRLAAGMRNTDSGSSSPIYFFDASSHDLLVDLPVVAEGHGPSIDALAYSPDGRRVASSAHDGTVRLWDADSGALTQTLEVKDGWVRCLAFHPTENLLATGEFDETVRIWDLDSGEQVREFTDVEGSVNAIAWTPDGRSLATAHDQLVCLRDPALQEPLYVLRGHQDDVTGLSFHPDGQRLASASLDGTIRIWDQGRGTHLLTLRAGKPCSAITFSPDGGRLYTAVDTDILVYETTPPVVTYDLRRGRLLATDEAHLLFQTRLDRFVAPTAVIENLEQDEAIDPVVRAEALRLARNFGTNPQRLADTAWMAARSRSSTDAAYAEALRLAKAANTMETGQARLLSVLGAAYYRMGDDESAISALQLANTLDSPEDTSRLTWNLLFIAMAKQRLGESGTARELLRQAREAGADDNRYETRSLMREANELINTRRD
jgi:WD40 repeat protein